GKVEQRARVRGDASRRRAAGADRTDGSRIPLWIDQDLRDLARCRRMHDHRGTGGGKPSSALARNGSAHSIVLPQSEKHALTPRESITGAGGPAVVGVPLRPEALCRWLSPA